MTVENITAIFAGVIAIGALCASVAAILTLKDKVTKPITDLAKEIKAIKEDLASFKNWQMNQQHDIDASKAEREILCRGFRALCNWAIKQGAGDDVHETLEELNVFLYSKAHEGKSYMRPYE